MESCSRIASTANEFVPNFYRESPFDVAPVNSAFASTVPDDHPIVDHPVHLPIGSWSRRRIPNERSIHLDIQVLLGRQSLDRLFERKVEGK